MTRPHRDARHRGRNTPHRPAEPAPLPDLRAMAEPDPSALLTEAEHLARGGTLTRALLFPEGGTCVTLTRNMPTTAAVLDPPEPGRRARKRNPRHHLTRAVLQEMAAEEAERLEAEEAYRAAIMAEREAAEMARRSAARARWEAAGRPGLEAVPEAA